MQKCSWIKQTPTKPLVRYSYYSAVISGFLCQVTTYFNSARMLHRENSPRQSRQWCRATVAARVDGVGTHTRGVVQLLTQSTRRPCRTTARTAPKQQHASTRNLRSRTDMHLITCDLDLWPSDPKVDACRGPATGYRCTKFCVDSSSHFSL